MSLIILTSCKDYHNDMAKWANDIPSGTVPQRVKAVQPDYLTIDWDNPDTLDNGMIRYNVTNIKGHNDALKMAYFLEFDNNGYRGQFAHK